MHDLHQVRHFGHHAADGGRVRPFHHLVQPRETQTLNHSLLLGRGTNGGAHPLQVNFPAARTRLLRRHAIPPGTRYWVLGTGYKSSTVLPRSAATCSRFFSCFSASKVALITLCGLVVPMDLVNTF